MRPILPASARENHRNKDAANIRRIKIKNKFYGDNYIISNRLFTFSQLLCSSVILNSLHLREMEWVVYFEMDSGMIKISKKNWQNLPFWHPLCKLLIISVLKISFGLTANFGERFANSLLPICQFSPRNLRSNLLGCSKTIEKSWQNDVLAHDSFYQLFCSSGVREFRSSDDTGNQPPAPPERREEFLNSPFENDCGEPCFGRSETGQKNRCGKLKNV